jgi:hypothetical protein
MAAARPYGPAGLDDTEVVSAYADSADHRRMEGWIGERRGRQWSSTPFGAPRQG